MLKSIYKLILIFSLFFVTLTVSASSPPPPPPPDPGGGGIPIGGTAPVGSGLVILLSMAAAYGAKKVYDARRKLEE